jgi:hypothetical protein
MVSAVQEQLGVVWEATHKSGVLLPPAGGVVVAAVVEREGKFHKVVALGTGNKFLKHEHDAGFDGTRVIDCHAEVIARRAFVLYLAEARSASRSCFGGSSQVSV